MLAGFVFVVVSLAAPTPAHLADHLVDPRAFSEGLELFYAFNDNAAVTAFQRAAATNNDCTLCYWGMAQAHARVFLLTDDPADRIAGLTALQHAEHTLLTQGRGANALEMALVRATQVVLMLGHFTKLRAYAATMGVVFGNWPDHPDVGALYALALLGESPSCHWMGPEMLPDDAPLFGVLEHVLQIDPTHIGAHHFYIHARERSNHPELGLESARALPLLAAHLGHMVHMPSHIYLRVGDYAAAVQSNLDAIAVDDDWFAGTMQRGVYYDLFYLHNHHFLWSARMMLGEHAAALQTARALQTRMHEHLSRKFPLAHELFAASELLTHIRFRDWDAAMAAEAPGGAGPYVLSLQDLAHGLARLADGDVPAAQGLLQQMEARKDTLGATRTQRLGKLARMRLAAEIARAEGRWEDAAQLYMEGITLEDTLPYAEPWLWQLPFREAYAHALLARGDFAEVMIQCKAELHHHPHSPFAEQLCAAAHSPL